MNHKHLSRYLKIGLLLIFVTASGCKNSNSQPSDSQFQDNLAETSDGFVQDPNTQNQSKPFKYTITTDLENDSNLKSVLDKLKNEEGSITVDITVDSMDGKYPIKYDLDCEGDGEYEFKGLTESHYCKYKLNSGKHQIWVRGEIPAMRLCSPEFEYSSYSASVYDIYIERWRKNGQVVISVDDWGDIPFRTMSKFAMHCIALKQIPVDPPILNDVTDLSYMFAGTNSFNQSLENWDVSKVTNMSWMFHQAASFDQPLESWDVSHVTDMSNMFSGYISNGSAPNNQFNQPLEKWDVSNVTNMEFMFANNEVYNQPLEKWDVSNVTNMQSMFTGAKAFNQPLEKWDVSHVTDMSWMFFGAVSFNQPLEKWNVSQVTDMSFMFAYAFSFNQPLESWDVSKVTDMRAMFDSAKSFNQPLEKWDVSNVTSMYQMFSNATSFNQPLEKWDVSNVTDMGQMFSYATSFNQPLDKWKLTKIRTMNSMFNDASAFSYYPAKWVVPDKDCDPRFRMEMKPGENCSNMFARTPVEKKAKAKPLKTFVPPIEDEEFADVEYVDIAQWCRPGMKAQISDQEWAKANNAFGLKLLRLTEGNTVFSPYSIERAMGMVLEGACFTTADEMLKALELPNAKRLSMTGLSVEHSLRNVNSNTTLRIENRLWTNEKDPMPDDFVSRFKAGYRRDITPLDYENPAQAVKIINEAVAKATNNKITSLIPNNAITPQTKVIGTNAVYFRSKWNKPFDKADTQKETFYNSGSPNMIDMMHQSAIHGHVCTTNDYAILDLSFNSSKSSSIRNSSGSYVLRIILPTVNASSMNDRMELLKKVENQLSYDTKANCTEKVYSVNLSLPKFKLTPDPLPIKGILKNLGMHKAFTMQAEFFASSIGSPKPPELNSYLKLEDIWHKAVIEVDETGAEAAAATAVFGIGGGGAPPPSYQFTVDHPFLFMIIEQSTGVAVFMGRVTEL